MAGEEELCFLEPYLTCPLRPLERWCRRCSELPGLPTELGLPESFRYKFVDELSDVELLTTDDGGLPVGVANLGDEWWEEGES